VKDNRPPDNRPGKPVNRGKQIQRLGIKFAP
jgi:hypothetical protein